jgi:hypothetical protein
LVASQGIGSQATTEGIEQQLLHVNSGCTGRIDGESLPGIDCRLLQDALVQMDDTALTVEQLDALSRAVPDDSERDEIAAYLRVRCLSVCLSDRLFIYLSVCLFLCRLPLHLVVAMAPGTSCTCNV